MRLAENINIAISDFVLVLIPELYKTIQIGKTSTKSKFFDIFKNPEHLLQNHYWATSILGFSFLAFIVEPLMAQLHVKSDDVMYIVLFCFCIYRQQIWKQFILLECWGKTASEICATYCNLFISKFDLFTWPWLDLSKYHLKWSQQTK